ncbi:MAG: hypothetical protein OEN55_15400 [Alphaproteobacteria bacterium]|nr:hypothetical protein [Alphaproteobacteria bacterium]
MQKFAAAPRVMVQMVLRGDLDALWDVVALQTPIRAHLVAD